MFGGSFTKYWKEHATIILDGHFTPENPLANYPLLKAEQNGHLIIGVYEDVVVEIGEATTIDLLNGKISDSIIVKNAIPNNSFTLTVWNCQGDIEKKESVVLEHGVWELKINAAGMARLEK